MAAVRTCIDPNEYVCRCYLSCPGYEEANCRQTNRETDRRVCCRSDKIKTNPELAKDQINIPCPGDMTPVLITIHVVFGTDCTEYIQKGTAEQQS